MPEYYYRARTRLGDVTKGTITAVSVERAGQMLVEHGLTPLEVRDAKEVGVLRREFALRGVGVRDRAIFARQLATMIEAGIPILQAIRILARQTENSRLADILREAGYAVEGGSPLSDALEKYPKVFTTFFVSMVRSGEASGRTAQSLHTLADHEERDAEIRRKVRAALVYPAFIIVLMGVLLVILTVFILPPLVDLFKEAKVDLPLTTRGLLALTNFLRGYWWFVALFVGLVTYLFATYIRTSEGRYNWSAFLLRIPTIGRLLRKLYLARFSGALQTLLDAEVPVVRSLLIARDVIENRVYQTIFEQTAEDVKNGMAISAAFERYSEIPLMVTEMVSVGERSGQLGQAFASIFRFYRRDVDDALANITTLLEPLVIVIIGVGVGLLLGAVLVPLYSLIQALA